MSNSLMNNEENNVLVMFPASKNFPIENEEVVETPSFFDERFEEVFDNDLIELEDDEIYPSLDAFMNRHKRDVALSPDDKLAMKINQQLEAIYDAKERIKFYLEEIDIFMPRRH